MPARIESSNDLAARFMLRQPGAAHDAIKAAANAGRRSMNAEIVRALELHIQKGPAEAATSPDHGSSHPLRKGKSNMNSDTTAPAGAPVPRVSVSDRLDALRADVLRIQTTIGLVNDLAMSGFTYPANRETEGNIGDVKISEREADQICAVTRCCEELARKAEREIASIHRALLAAETAEAR